MWGNCSLGLGEHGAQRLSRLSAQVEFIACDMETWDDHEVRVAKVSQAMSKFPEENPLRCNKNSECLMFSQEAWATEHVENFCVQICSAEAIVGAENWENAHDPPFRNGFEFYFCEAEKNATMQKIHNQIRTTCTIG